MGGEAGGREGQTSQTQICKILSNSIEKKRQCTPFFKFCLEDGWAGTPAGAGASLARGNAFN